MVVNWSLAGLEIHFELFRYKRVIYNQLLLYINQFPLKFGGYCKFKKCYYVNSTFIKYIYMQ